MGLTTTEAVCVVFMTTLCFFVLAMLLQSPDLKMVCGEKTMHGTKFRKVLYALEEKEKRLVFTGGNENENGNGNGKKKKKSTVEWELRAAPLGPDPLHHNGGSPRKKPTRMP